MAGKELPADLYIFISGHFIKYKVKGDLLDTLKYDQIQQKQIQYLFTLKEDNTLFQKWANDIINQEKEDLVENLGEENREVVTVHQDIKREVSDFLLTSHVSKKSVQILQEKVITFVDKISAKKEVKHCLPLLLKYGQHFADHALNVANMSVFFATYMAMNNPKVLENLYLGALYHDIGKVKINPEKYKNNPKGHILALKKHPQIGKTMLMATSSLPPQVLEIVSQHHERYDGKGYPKKISGNRISDLARLVSIANTLDHYAEKSEGSIRDRFNDTIKTLSADQGHKFDPRKLSQCLEVLKILTKSVVEL